jgi:hypothetical protein
MKTIEEYLDELCPMFVYNETETLYTYKDVLELLKQVQTDAYNKALGNAVENVKLLFHDGFHKENKEITYFQSGQDNIQISKQSILKLKK